MDEGIVLTGFGGCVQDSVRYDYCWYMIHPTKASDFDEKLDGCLGFPKTLVCSISRPTGGEKHFMKTVSSLQRSGVRNKSLDVSSLRIFQNIRNLRQRYVLTASVTWWRMVKPIKEGLVVFRNLYSVRSRSLQVSVREANLRVQV